MLSALIAEAGQSNLDLQMAGQRVEESRAQAGLVDASAMPQLGLGAGYARSANSAKSPVVRLGASTYGYDLWQAGFQASWELDLWGHQRRQSEAAQAGVEASRYGREAVRVAVASEVARTYLLLRGVQADTAFCDQGRQLAGQALSLYRSRARNGVATRADVALAEARLEQWQAQWQSVARQGDALMNALALLLGLPPQQLDARLSASPRLPALPEQVPVGVSSELARRRPDILQAEARLHAATADIGAAQADFYPRVSLNGNFGTLAFTGRDLGDWKSRQFAAGPTLYLPVFDGGRLRQTLALSETRQREAGLAYRQTVLRAWHEVDDALDAYATEKRRHARFEAVAGQYQLALAQTRRTFEEGAADRLAVLEAQQGALAAERARSDSATAGALSVVALYKALGGGWSPSAQEAGS
jgi:NodT family efflux transporter outer membrane factor (OMF) lipoprotein